MTKRLIRWFATALICTTVVGVVLFAVTRIQQESVVNTHESTIASIGESQTHFTTEVGDSTSGSGDPTSDLSSSFKDFGYHCPTIHGELTEDCLRALDNRFGEELTQDGPLVPVCDQPTWRQIFDDPVAKREKVVDALSREECRPENDEIRSRTDCARNEIAELGVLYRQCSQFNDYRLGAEFAAKPLPELLDSVESDDFNTYRQERQRIQTEYYRERWIAARCGLVDQGVFEQIDDLSEMYSGQKFRLGRRTQELESFVVIDEVATDRIRNLQQQLRVRSQGNTLRTVAARLGHYWALSEYTQYGAFLDDLFLLNPAQALSFVADEQARTVLSFTFVQNVHPGLVSRELSTVQISLEETRELLVTSVRERPPTSVPDTELLSGVQATDLIFLEEAPTYSLTNVREALTWTGRDPKFLRRAYVHAALLFMQQQGIQYSKEAVPEWAADPSGEELTEAHAILEWLGEKYPGSSEAPNPGAKETCERGTLALLPDQEEEEFEETRE